MGNQGSSPHEPLDRMQVPQNATDFKMVRTHLIILHYLFIIQHVESAWVLAINVSVYCSSCILKYSLTH